MNSIFFIISFLSIISLQAGQEARPFTESPTDFSMVRVLQYPDKKIIIHVKNEQDGTEERMDTPPGFFDNTTFDILTSEELAECVANLQQEISEKESELQKFKLMQQAGQAQEAPPKPSVEHHVRQAIDEYQDERQEMCKQLISMRVQLRSAQLAHPAQIIVPEKTDQQKLMDALQAKFKNALPDDSEHDKSDSDECDF